MSRRNQFLCIASRPRYLFVLLPLTALLFTAATPSQEMASPTVALAEVMPREKSLLKSVNFTVVDDFNAGEMKNRGGGVWRGETPKGGKLNLGVDGEDARMESRGHSLRARFELEKKDRAVIESDLDLDVSRAEHFVFKGKIRFARREKEEPGDWKMQLSFSDNRGRRQFVDVTDQWRGEEGVWQDIAVSMKAFGELDLNQVANIRLALSARKGELAGEFWVDEMAFYGTGNIGFLSRKDNLMGFPEQTEDEERRLWLLDKGTRVEYRKVFLREIAKDTWTFFANARDRKTQLIVDHVRVGEKPLAADYTSPTNIAMDLIGTVAAFDLGFIEKKEAVSRIEDTMDTLKKLKRWNGLFYNFYDTTNLQVTRNFVSTVDNGWLFISFVIVRQAFPEELGKLATRFLDSAHFEEFLDPENNQLSIGYDGDRRELTPNHYGMLASEARATSYLAIGKGDVPPEHWWFIYRTPPEAWTWQNQVPRGAYTEADNVDYFQGYYQYGDRAFVPSWGGSLFEYLMPTLVIKERELAPQGLGANNKVVTEIQREYALKEKGYPVWGISPAAITNGKNWHYGEYGIKGLSVKGYPDRGIITPHVSFLALDVLPDEAVENITNLLHYSIYGEYGFFDSVDILRKKVNPQYLALDQGMILIALANYLKNGSIQERFHADSVGKQAENLLMKESFFNG